jgi:hypothetical protein
LEAAFDKWSFDRPTQKRHATNRLVETVVEENDRARPYVLVEQQIIKAQAKQYVRQTQERLITAPILQLLTAQHRERGTLHPNYSWHYWPAGAVDLRRSKATRRATL